MSRCEQLVRTILGGRSDANIRFDELRGLMRYLGFEERIRGSHYLFDKEGIVEIVVPSWRRSWAVGRPRIDGVGRGNPVPYIAMTKIQFQGIIQCRARGVWGGSAPPGATSGVGAADSIRPRHLCSTGGVRGRADGSDTGGRHCQAVVSAIPGASFDGYTAHDLISGRRSRGAKLATAVKMCGEVVA